MLISDPTNPGMTPPAKPVYCENTKKPCGNARDLFAFCEGLRRAMIRSVLVGAAIGAAGGAMAKDGLELAAKAWLGL